MRHRLSDLLRRSFKAGLKDLTDPWNWLLGLPLAIAAYLIFADDQVRGAIAFFVLFFLFGFVKDFARYFFKL